MGKLFTEIGPRFKDRPGGYLRILKSGIRNGDTAPMAVIQLVDYNFDNQLNVTDVVLMVNFVLNQSTPTEEELLTGDMNQDGILNILDVITLVGEILGTTFAQSVEWLEENFPELETKERLSKLNKSMYFSK